MITQLIISLVSVGMVSLVVGISGYLLNSSFWAFFLLAAAVQFTLFFVIKTYQQYRFQKDIIKKEIEKITPLSTILECAYCHEKNLITFEPDNHQRTQFKCQHCEKTNSVYIQFTVAQITDPIVIPNSTLLPVEAPDKSL